MTTDTLTAGAAGLDPSAPTEAPETPQEATGGLADALTPGYMPEPVLLDPKALAGDVEALVRDLAGFMTATSVERVSADLDAEDRAFRTDATIRGVLVVGEDVAQQHRANVERDLRDRYQAEARALAQRLDAATTLLDAACESRQILPSEVATAKPAERLLARLVDVLATQEARTRLAGMTAQEALDVYRATPDGAAPEMLRLVEHEILTGRRSLAFRESGDRARDVVAVSALSKAIHERRAARVPEALRAARETLRATRASATVSFMLSMVASGQWRRVAS